jgi:hypothetical protein
VQLNPKWKRHINRRSRLFPRLDTAQKERQGTVCIFAKAPHLLRQRIGRVYFQTGDIFKNPCRFLGTVGGGC